jgi:hypothetical protein
MIKSPVVSREWQVAAAALQLLLVASRSFLHANAMRTATARALAALLS